VLGPDSVTSFVDQTFHISLGGSAAVGVADQVPVPAAIDLSQNFPDPFSDVTQCSFYLPVAAPVSITLFDIRGRLVRELAQGHYSSGTHQFVISGNGLPAGLYSCVLQSGGIMRTRLMQRMK
jgi:hypothetical protein